MATKRAAKVVKNLVPVDSQDLVVDTAPRPRLQSLSVKNFRAIGSAGVSIVLDDIVVLVGPNNAGKSSILRAYELVMFGEQSKESELSKQDFHKEIVDPQNLPEVILETIAFARLPDEKLCQKQGDKDEYLVRERWTWSAVAERPKRVGFNFEDGNWSDKFPWGPANIAQANRPKVHRVDAFSNPDEQAKEILSILQDYLIGRLLSPDEDETGLKLKEHQDGILKQIGEVRNTLVVAAGGEIKEVETELSRMMSQVFPNYEVKFEASTEETNISFLSAILKNEASLKMGLTGDFQSPLKLQGSGARRTLLWSILRLIAEKELTTGKGKKGKDAATSKPHVLLLDEPEICLHPNAIREACRTLYDLPTSGRWQVMVTTHCPVFIDLSRDNTTIVRVERSTTGAVQGTTIYRPKDLELSKDDKQRIKMLNIYDPYVAEFFFGGRTIIVEGDTEYSAFKFLIATYADEYRDLHIVKARGKATIVLLVKILEKFSTQIAVLHDADVPKVKTKKGERVNSAWTLNTSINEACAAGIAAGRIRLVASVSTFEVAYFGEEQSTEKPYHTLEILRSDKAKLLTVKNLLDALLDLQKPLPSNAVAWTQIGELDFVPADVSGKQTGEVIAMLAVRKVVNDDSLILDEVAAEVADN